MNRVQRTRLELTRDTKIVLAVFAAIPVLILAASALCSWAIAEGASMRWRALFGALCHGAPERSLELFGIAMPICARCVGIYVGMLSGLLLFPLMGWLREPVMRAVAFIAIVPLGIDGLTQFAGLRESTNALRIATGLVAGIAFGLWILSALRRRDDALFTTS